MTTAVLLVSRNRDKTDALAASLASAFTTPFELWTVAVGGDRTRTAPSARLWLADERRDGFAASIALAAARGASSFETLMVMSDAADLTGLDLPALLARFEREPRLGLIAPRPSLCLLRSSATGEVGFLESALGLDEAVTELTQRLTARGWTADVRRDAEHDARARVAAPANLRVFAWPDWRNRSEVALLVERFAAPLVGHAEACLCLRRDPASDPSSDDVVQVLSEEHARLLGAEAELNVVIVDDELSRAQWSELERAIDVAVALPSSRGGDRAVMYATLGRKVVHDAEAMLRGADAPLLDSVRAALPQGASGTTAPVDAGLVERIKALHPWFYPVTIGGLHVSAGVGSHVAHDFLENRTKCRSMLLVDEVARRYDLRGKSVLELACNCAYWSARYAELGATKVVGLEGRDEYVRQAELYWSNNHFLPQGNYEFLRGNISDAADWRGLRERGPFDVVLCAGILYHVPNYREILRWAAELTREVFVVDTRVSDAPETPIEEPGELYFNAIRETRVKVVPNRARLVAALDQLGFAVEALPVRFAAQLGVQDLDDYAAGNAVTLLARRVSVPTSLANSRAGIA